MSNQGTWEHIRDVQVVLTKVQEELAKRCLSHDRTKLFSPEVEIFSTYANKLDTIVFGSPEYEKQIALMAEAIDHHYKHNRHHPQHFENGIDGMNLIDLLEMLADWIVSVKRSKDGDLERSLEFQQARFDISPQLMSVLKNTIESLSDD
jgi:hypothetical protein